MLLASLATFEHRESELALVAGVEKHPSSRHDGGHPMLMTKICDRESNNTQQSMPHTSSNIPESAKKCQKQKRSSLTDRRLEQRHRYMLEGSVSFHSHRGNHYGILLTFEVDTLNSNI